MIHTLSGKIKVSLLATLFFVTACESSRVIATRAEPGGVKIKCVGLSNKGKVAGIDYDLSIRNTILGVVFVESIAPPIFVLVKETYCPVSDTSTAPIAPARQLKVRT